MSYKVLIFFIVFVFVGCLKDEYFTQVYDKQLLNKPIGCLKLKLLPYSTNVFNETKNLYDFSDDCQNTLEIKYKTNIACNSQFNTNKQFKSFVQLTIYIKKKLLYTIYKDLTNENINKEIKKGYKRLCKTIQL
jgi:hypothetical protein